MDVLRKKGAGPVIVTKDVTWKGAVPLDAYRFHINSKGKRYEFAVLHACGNIALRNVTDSPSTQGTAAPGKAAAPAAKPSTPDKTAVAPSKQKPGDADIGKAGVIVGSPSQIPATTADSAAGGAKAPAPAASADKAAAVTPSPKPGAADSGVAGSASSMPGTSADRAAAVTPSPITGTTESGAAGSVAPTPGALEKASAGTAASTSIAKFFKGAIVDTGFARQFDPASYLFVRIGYEFPLYDKLGLIASLGGYFRINGHDGGTAVIADAILDYHWWNRLSFGLGAGFWGTDNDGQLDLIANMGVLVYGKPDSFNSTLFLEARSAVDKLDHLNDEGRFGLGIRFRF